VGVAKRIDTPQVAAHNKSMNEPQPAGEKYFELRATAADPTLDSLLAAFTNKEVRPAMPGFLYLYSAQTYRHFVDDIYDGESRKEMVLAAYKRQVGDFSRSKFSLEPTVVKRRVEISDKPSTVIELQIQLGAEAARRVIAPPFFELGDVGLLGVRYQIPHPVRGHAAPKALEALQSYLESNPRGVVDELVIVQSAFRDRSIAARHRVREVPKQPSEKSEPLEQSSSAA